MDPRVSAWLVRATTWRGTIDANGPPQEPVFLLLGDRERLPGALRELAETAPGGATVPLSAEVWALIEGQLDAWLTPGARRCVTAIRDGRAAPAAVLERSEVHAEPTFVPHHPSCTRAWRVDGSDPEPPPMGAGADARL